jgi:hypothetical protein
LVIPPLAAVGTVVATSATGVTSFFQAALVVDVAASVG